MAPKGGTCILVLIVACAAAVKPSDASGKNTSDVIVRKLMMKCRENVDGDAVRQMIGNLQHTVFNSGNLPIECDDYQAKSLRYFRHVLDSVTKDKDRDSMDFSDKMKYRCLSTIIQQMKGDSESYACYMNTFMDPTSMEAVISRCANRVTDDGVIDDRKELLLAAEPVQDTLPSARMNLPAKVNPQKMHEIMKKLWERFNSFSEEEKTYVAKWEKKQIIQNKYNCTMNLPSNSRSGEQQRCKTQLKWMGPVESALLKSFILYLASEDFESSSTDNLCNLIRSEEFASMKSYKCPTICTRLLQKTKECYTEKEFAERLDKLGPLACCSEDVPRNDPKMAKKLLDQLDHCENPNINRRKRLIKLALSNLCDVEALEGMNKNANLVFKELYQCGRDVLKKIIKNMALEWKQSQQCMLAKTQLGDRDKVMRFKDIEDVLSLIKTLPVSTIKGFKSDEIVKDKETLEDISSKMSSGQKKALMKLVRPVIREDMPDSLASQLSLNSAKKADLTTADKLENKPWSLAVKANLAKEMYKQKGAKFSNWLPVLGGVTCKMIESATEGDDLTEAIKKALQLLSVVQMRSVALKMFATLEAKRKDYFKSITQSELDVIPTCCLLRLPPSKVEDLPDSVCPMFLKKIENANLTMLPLRACSRPALTMRALQCLTNGSKIFELTVAKVTKLGQFVCELPPDKLRFMNDEVLNFTLVKMTTCQHIPQRHREDLVQLVKETYGDPSTWANEMMENVGPLMCLRDNAISHLPIKPWAKAVLSYVSRRGPCASRACKSKWFMDAMKSSLVTTASPNNPNSQSTDFEPTEEMIDQLGECGYNWTLQELDKISTKTFLDIVDMLGKYKSYSVSQLAVLKKKAVEAFGPPSEITECRVMQLGCITQGFSNSELQMLPFSLGSLEEINNCGWTESQRRSVWTGVALRNKLTVQKLEASEMVSLNGFLCGLTTSEIQQLNITEFGDAVHCLDGLKCSWDKMQQAKRLVVSLFNVPATWDEALISELSNIIPCLNADELASLDPSVLSFISETSIPLIPPDSLIGLSIEHLKSLGAVNAEKLTPAQLEMLDEEQRAAVEEAATEADMAPRTSAESGAPSLGVEGVSAFMKPLLFLCICLVLL